MDRTSNCKVEINDRLAIHSKCAKSTKLQKQVVYPAGLNEPDHHLVRTNAMPRMKNVLHHHDIGTSFDQHNPVGEEKLLSRLLK